MGFVPLTQYSLSSTLLQALHSREPRQEKQQNQNMISVHTNKVYKSVGILIQKKREREREKAKRNTLGMRKEISLKTENFKN